MSLSYLDLFVKPATFHSNNFLNHLQLGNHIYLKFIFFGKNMISILFSYECFFLKWDCWKFKNINWCTWKWRQQIQERFEVRKCSWDHHNGLSFLLIQKEEEKEKKNGKIISVNFDNIFGKNMMRIIQMMESLTI